MIYHTLIRKALEKIGAKSFNDLNEFEIIDFQRWEEALREKKITSEDAIASLEALQEKILSELEDRSIDVRKQDNLLAQISVLRFILRTVKVPKEAVNQVQSEIESFLLG